MIENDDEKNLPFVSALLVTRNEQDYIQSALMSYIKQSYPKDRYEVIVIDGESTDRTVDIIEEIKKKYETDEFKISVLNNPKRILASGWNIGIKAARGEYVIRIDAHAKAYPDFIQKSVETMIRINAVCVGGKLITKTIQDSNEAIAKVFSSSFGVGNSSFRVSDNAGYVDTAVYGLYRKSIFEEAGYFDEKYARNQDLQMHSRIRRRGGKFYFNPEIRCEYYARNTIKKMIGQAFGNGKWNMTLLKEDPAGLSIRHLVPFAFVIFLVIASLGGIAFKPLWILELCVISIHLVLGLYFGRKSGAQGCEMLQMPILFLLFHLAYGSGSLVGIFK